MSVNSHGLKLVGLDQAFMKLTFLGSEATHYYIVWCFKECMDPHTHTILQLKVSRYVLIWFWGKVASFDDHC